MKGQRSLAGRLHIAWLVNLLIVLAVLWAGFMWLTGHARAADIYGTPQPQRVILVTPQPKIDPFGQTAPARTTAEPIIYVLLGGADVGGVAHAG